MVLHNVVSHNIARSGSRAQSPPVAPGGNPAVAAAGFRSTCLARVHSGVVHCVYAIEVSRVLADLDIINPRKLAKEARERSSLVLKSLVAPDKIPASRIHMPLGKVGPAVNGVAKKLNADLLVMGTTARRGLKGLVIGNSAERVLASSTRDILALKP